MEILIRYEYPASSINSADRIHGRTVLHAAVLGRNGQTDAERYECVRVACENNADINATDETGKTALMHIIALNPSPPLRLVRLLLNPKYGADINIADVNQRTALHLTLIALRGENDLNINLRWNAEGNQKNNILELVSLLLDRGADTNLIDRDYVDGINGIPEMMQSD